MTVAPAEAGPLQVAVDPFLLRPRPPPGRRALDFPCARRHDVGMHDTLARLEATIASRRGTDAASSYVASLFAKGRGRIARKLGEEAVETIVAALSEDKPALVGEAADTLFHLLVLLADADVALADVLAELDRREGMSGHDEKASRKT